MKKKLTKFMIVLVIIALLYGVFGDDIQDFLLDVKVYVEDLFGRFTWS